MSRFCKALLICGLVLAALGWVSYNNPSQSAQISLGEIAKLKSDDYVGSDACKDCHEDQFKNFSHTSHAQLTKLASWKEKVTGCESCHGPGKAHSEEGDPKKIISFKNKSSKEISETCLACHAGGRMHSSSVWNCCDGAMKTCRRVKSRCRWVITPITIWMRLRGGI